MKNNKFIWADLSCYEPKQSQKFYEEVFGWKYYHTDASYRIAFQGNSEVVGLYETPEKFKQMRMPHFWMTYIQVNDLLGTVEQARNHGAIIEMVDEESQVALIRDPMGAGFTIYAGDEFDARTESTPGRLIWNELHVSDASKVIPFYQAIFNWKIEANDEHNYFVYDKDGTHISTIQELSNDVKGKYEYWVSCFGTSDLQETKSRILDKGGLIVLDEGSRILFTDNGGQAFFYAVEV